MPTTDSGRWLVLSLLCASQFMVVLDFSIVNVALPAMENDLGFSQQNLQWVISAYALTFGGFLLLGGRAADLFGRRRVFMAGLSLFTLASLVGGLAESQWVLIAARGFQGLGGAILDPAALSILTTTFTEGQERNRALSIWGAMGAVAFALGVLLGGVLTDGISWRWVMFVNVPVGIAAVALSPVLLRESRKQTLTQQIDLAGAVTVTGGLVLLVYALVQAPEAGWFAATTVLLFGGSIVFLALFVWVEERSPAPLVPLMIFRSSTLTGANLVGALLSAAVASMVYILTLYMQQVLGYTALQTGMAFLPHALAAMVAAPLTSRLIKRIGVKSTMVSGMVAVMVGLLLLTHISVQGNFVRELLPGTVFVGFGIMIGIVTVTIAATAGVADSEQGLASGLLNTAQQMGSAVGLAILVAVATARTQAIAATTGNLLIATTRGFQAALAVGAGFAAIGIIVALLVIREQKSPRLR
ncbi:MAG: MFS transporter [Stigonema ocellatum SAG 48.90 = DSM 106950]|nr:MFS transporter [Stigonema ocellatum SAG 48.90 = DSM 106950]